MTISVSSLYRDTPLCFFFISLATVFDAFTVQNINFLFIALTTFLVVFIVVANSKAFPKPEVDFILPVLGIFMLGVSIATYETARWTGIEYSLFFIVTFIIYAPLFKKFVTVDSFRLMLKIIFYIYLIGLLVGQLDHYLHAMDGLKDLFFFMRGTLGVVMEPGGVRFFSFSSEPSYAAFIVVTIFYGYIRLDPKKSNIFSSENLFMLFVLMYMIIMFRSAYGVILLGLVAVEYLGFSKALIGVLIISVAVAAYQSEVEIKALTRVINVFQKIDISDPHTLYAIDFTAYYRVAPVLHYLEMADLIDISFLIGHGPGASRLYVVPEIYGGYIGGEFLGGFIPAFLYDYGVIGGVLVLIFLYRQVPSVVSFQAVVLGLMLLNANFNTQLFWFLVLNFHLLKYYRGAEFAAKSPLVHAVPA